MPTRESGELAVERVGAGAELARRAVAIGIMAALTAAAAKVAVPVPGTPVPFTLQPLAVLLAGLLLGPVAGATSQAAYLTAGAAGLPVFAAGGGAAYLLGPTGGYLLAYPVAAFLAGYGARRGPWATAAGLLGGVAAIHAGGLAWMAALVGASAALQQAVLPFLAVDVLKAGFAFVLDRLAGTRLRELLS